MNRWVKVSYFSTWRIFLLIIWLLRKKRIFLHHSLLSHWILFLDCSSHRCFWQSRHRAEHLVLHEKFHTSLRPFPTIKLFDAIWVQETLIHLFRILIFRCLYKVARRSTSLWNLLLGEWSICDHLISSNNILRQVLNR